MKLWDKGTPIDAIMESFTVGDDRTVDVRLARWDVVGCKDLLHLGVDVFDAVFDHDTSGVDRY